MCMSMRTTPPVLQVHTMLILVMFGGRTVLPIDIAIASVHQGEPLVMKNFNDEYHGGEDSNLGDEEL